MRLRVTTFIAVFLALGASLGAQVIGASPSAGNPQIDMANWRLELTGGGLENPLVFTYEELLQLPTAAKSEELVCPGLFAYTAEWEGVPLPVLLQKAGAGDQYEKVSFIAVDGYTFVFTREEVESHLLFLALKVNGKPLPPAEGFPVRLVAVGFSGGRWVRWLSEIRVE